MPTWGNIDYTNFSESLGPWYERQQQPRQSTNSRNVSAGDDDPQPDNPISMDQVFGMADRIYKSNPLNRQEKDRLGTLSNRAQRLQPMDQEQVYGSRATGGNPYSIDTTNILTGAANAAKGGINRARRNRTSEFADEYSNLASRQEQAQEAAEGRQEFLGDMLPEAALTQYKQGQQTQRNTDDNQARAELEENKAGWRQDLENLQHENRKKLEEHKGRVGGSDFTKQGGMFRDLSGMADDEIGLINENINSIQTQIQGAMGDPERQKGLESDLQELESRKQTLQNAKGLLHRSGGKYNESEVIDRYMDMLQGNPDGNTPVPGSELISENNKGQQMTPERIEEIVRGIMQEGDSGGAPTSQVSSNDPSNWFD